MPVNFSWIEPGKVAGMARPFPAHAAWLKQQGITAVLSLTESDPDLEGFENVHIPIADMTSPTLDMLHQAVSFVRHVVANGGAVVVHCGAGMGRTGTVLAAYLVSLGRTAREAIADVRAARPGSIETPDQEAILFRYAELIGGSGT